MLNEYVCYLSESVLFRLVASFRGHLARFVRPNALPDEASEMPAKASKKELTLKGNKNIH